jgi:hypothetical protein
MEISFDELCRLIANAKSVRHDFWKEDPLYIKLGVYAERRVLETEAFSVVGGPDIAVDLNSNGEAAGIGFLPS